ncbi:hypothetical protein GGX14DRAFT_555319 [Mycena pura]|uniref:Uncharacterized protein n=1 Tax=Mycena pura TaxID=153505 RepID=A0AAD6YQT6_9AGAR|nr:hypothetical protein GGX14DRAFT_555319 [Mycena pura]
MDRGPFAADVIGPQRRPPNRHPAVVLAGALINDVFERTECQALIDAAGVVIMLPDEPTADSAAQLASVLAHNFTVSGSPPSQCCIAASSISYRKQSASSSTNFGSFSY